MTEPAAPSNSDSLASVPQVGYLTPAASHETSLPALAKLARSGFLSSEFWLVLIALGMLALAAESAKLPPDLAGVLGTVLVVGYKYFRASIKATAGDQIVQLADTVAAAPMVTLEETLPAKLAPALAAVETVIDGRTMGDAAREPAPVPAAAPGSTNPLPGSTTAAHVSGGIALLLAAALAGAWLLCTLTGCSSAADQAFRARVSNSTTSVGVLSNGQSTQVGVQESLTFRDPAAAGLAK